MAGTVMVVTRNGLGTVSPADEGFGLQMFDKLLHTLETVPNRPSVMCFYTEGVKLVDRDSPAALGLRLLEAAGVRMLVCQTCLERYGSADRLAVGEVGGMVEILRVMLEAEKVITVS
jgi:hypothetical protein